MNKLNSELKLLLKNQSGIALMMVLSSIVILTFILAEFTFESSINKMKAYSLQDKVQAKLNAESGLKFAMARLRLYKESYNYVQKNKDAKDFVSQELLNQIWNVPFVYPIPVGKKMGAREKAAIGKFTKSTLIMGEMLVSVRNISNLININMLRAPLMEKDEDDTNESEENDEATDEKYTVDYQIFDLIRKGIEREKEKDDDFESRNSNLEPEFIMSSLKFFISEKDTFSDGNTPQIEGEMSTEEITRKFTPFSSKSELHLVHGLTDEVIKLFTNDITAHGAVMIDLNTITENMLKVLLPSIDEDQVKDFFEYRDDPEAPHYFNKEEDFKKYVIEVGNILTEEDYIKRFDAFKKNGLKFGPSPTLFEISSMGKYKDTSYALKAIVSIPASPQEEPEPKKTDGDEEGEGEGEGSTTDGAGDGDGSASDDGSGSEEELIIIELLEPRVQEIYVE